MCGTACAPSTSEIAPAARMRDVRKGDQLHVAALELLVEMVEREFATLVHLEVAQLCAALAAQHLPRHDVRVVLHLGGEHGVAWADVRASPRIGDEVDRLGHVLREDRRPRLPADELRHLCARAVVGGV
jgi:arginase family enzyme